MLTTPRLHRRRHPPSSLRLQRNPNPKYGSNYRSPVPKPAPRKKDLFHLFRQLLVLPKLRWPLSESNRTEPPRSPLRQSHRRLHRRGLAQNIHSHWALAIWYASPCTLIGPPPLIGSIADQRERALTEMLRDDCLRYISGMAPLLLRYDSRVAPPAPFYSPTPGADHAVAARVTCRRAWI